MNHDTREFKWDDAAKLASESIRDSDERDDENRESSSWVNGAVARP